MTATRIALLVIVGYSTLFAAGVTLILAGRHIRERHTTPPTVVLEAAAVAEVAARVRTMFPELTSEQLAEVVAQACDTRRPQ